VVSQSLPLSFVHSQSLSHSQSVTHSQSLTFDFDFASLRCASSNLRHRRFFDVRFFDVRFFEVLFFGFFGGFRVGRFFRGFDCGWLWVTVSE